MQAMQPNTKTQMTNAIDVVSKEFRKLLVVLLVFKDVLVFKNIFRDVLVICSIIETHL